jgi:ubiquinone/menaquinone biosynthesis C-methylase UbiE/acyl carrier protein
LRFFKTGRLDYFYNKGSIKMTDYSSYHVNEIATDREREIARLSAQVDIFWPQERVLLKANGLVDGTTVLDAGCGSGRYSELLLEEYPHSSIIGIEQDAHFETTLRKLTESVGSTRFRHIIGSVYKTGLDSESIDCVIIRLVLEHLKDPETVLAEAFRLLKPGGIVVVVDNDFSQHLRTTPNIGELDALYDAYCRARRQEGGNPYIGRELPHVLLCSGFTNVSISVIAAHNAICGDEKFLRSEGSGIAAQLMRDGYLSKEAFDSLEKNWRSMLGHPHHSIMRILFMATGKKPIKGSFASVMQGETVNRITESPSGPRTDDQQKPVRESIIQKFAELLRMSPDDVELEASLVKQGLDSIAAVDLQSFIEEQFGVSINIALLYENRTAKEVIGIIESMIAHPDQKIENTSGEKEPKTSEETWIEGSI